MGKKILKTFDKLIVALLGLIPFLSGCDLISPSVCEYGTLWADYEISGKITDEMTSETVSNAKVICMKRYPTVSIRFDSTYTDKDGLYSFIFTEIPGDTITIRVEDYDGILSGGEFIPNEADVIGTDFKWNTKDSEDWYQGKATKTLDIKVKFKE